MSPRAPHLCGRASCLERVPAGTTYCDEHAPRWHKRPDQERPDTGRAEHMRVREQVLERDNRQCQLRLDRCIGIATELDHIISKADGGPTSVENGTSACRPCHQRRSAQQGGRAAAELRRSRALQEDPAVRRAMEARRTQKRRTQNRRTQKPPPEEWSPSVIRTKPPGW